MKLGDMMTVFWSLGDVMSMAQVFGVVTIGVHLCVKGEITLGTYLAFVSYTRQLTWPGPRAGTHAVGDEQGGRFHRPPAVYPRR